MPKLNPCRVKDGSFVVPCDALASCFDGNAWGKGRALYLNELTHLPTGKPSRSFVVMRLGEHRGTGIVLNVCPFCGTRIDAPVTNEKIAAPAA